MHKRNIHRNTDSVRRTARASQARLEEFSDKIEREKHKIIRSSHHEKNKVLNELKSIHRVFKPRLDVIRENQDGTLQIVENVVGDSDNSTESLVQPRSSGRAEAPATRRRHTEPNMMWRSCGERMPVLAQNHSRKDSGDAAPYVRQWCYRLGQLPNIEAGVPRLSVQIEREYLSKLRNAAETPCISDSMSSVSMGYLAFKRSLKNKRQTERLDRKFVDPRFRSIFLDAAELSAIPEQTDWTAGMDGNVSPHLVKMDRSQNRYFNGRLPTPVRKHCSLSSLSRPMADLQMSSWREGKRDLLSPNLLCGRGTDKLLMSAKQRPELKAERSETNKASGNYTWECSGFSERGEEEEDMFAKFDKNLREKILLSNNKNTAGFHSRSSKLLRPLGTGCFTKSFQAVSQIEK